MTFKEWWMTLLPAEVDELQPVFQDCWNTAQAAEREACAQICDEGAKALHCMGESDGANGAMSCAEAIRMRSNA